MKKHIFLAVYATILTIAFAAILFIAYKNKGIAGRVDEITVKRINLIGEDGSLRMVLSNEKRQHPGRFNGKDMPPRERGAGVIYFNTDGDECGGLVYGNMSKGEVTTSTMSLTMDQYKQDQVIQLLNSEYIEKGTAVIEKGLIINEHPVGSNLGEIIQQIEMFKKLPDEKERNEKIQHYMNVNAGKNRMFLGRSKDNSVGLFLKDSDGKTKMKIYVNAEGKPVIEVFDKSGEFINLIKSK